MAHRIAFTDQGLVRIEDNGQVSNPDAVINAADFIEKLRSPPTPQNPKASRSDLPLTQKIQNTKITPREVIRLATARVREIKAELRYHDRLQTELEQLERLLDAAKAMPKTAKTH